MDVDPERIWRGLDRLVSQLEPAHRALLEKRDQFQSQLDQWHRERGSERIDLQDYSQFLREIGYVEAEADGVEVCTENVDSEVAQIAGPQLVVPVDNARILSQRCQCALGKSIRCAVWNGCRFGSRRGDAQR